MEGFSISQPTGGCSHEAFYAVRPSRIHTLNTHARARASMLTITPRPRNDT